MQRSLTITFALVAVALVLASGPAAACHQFNCDGPEDCYDEYCDSVGVQSVVHDVGHHAPFGGLGLLAVLGAGLVVGRRRRRA